MIKRLKNISEGADIQRIFEELRNREIEVEKRGENLEYKGRTIEIEINPSEAIYKQKHEEIAAEDHPALTYFKTALVNHGYIEKEISGHMATYSDQQKI